MDNTSEKKSSQIFEKSEHTWIIDTFTKASNDYITGHYQDSSIFPENERKYKWRLKFYPNGEEKSEYVSSFLRPSPQFQCFVTFTLILKNSADEVIVYRKTEHSFDEETQGFGWPELVSRKKVISSLRDDDILKIQVVVMAEVLALQSYHTLSIQESESPTLKLSRDFGTMFNSNKFSDFVFKFTDDNEIPAHRFVLSARSPVFSAMFEYDTSETKEGYTKITDIGRDTMLILLNFIYTGNVENLPEEKAMQLLFAADKYQLEDLKERCTNTLRDSLHVSNVLEILICAEKHCVSELKIKCIEYILGNFKHFSDPKTFLELAQKYPRLIIELLTCSQNMVQKLKK